MWDYRAVPLRVTDGDTLTALVDVGFHARCEVDVRLARVSAPELRDPGGPECREYVLAWLGELAPVKWPLLVRTQPNTAAEPTERRSFARYLAEVHDIASARHLNGELRAYLALHPEWGGPGS